MADGTVNVSTRKNRVYKRKFDYDIARALHAEGHSYAAIAELLGVSQTAIARVCDERQRERLDAHTKDWLQRNKVPCLGGCGRTIYRQAGRSGYCDACYRARRAEAFPDARPGELRCAKCREWKPDDEFPTYKPVKARRGHNPWCRPCCNAARQAHRIAQPVLDIQANRRALLGHRRKGTGMQSYVVLRPEQSGPSRRWVEVGIIDAVSPVHAIEELATEDGTYVAVQSSRMKPFTVQKVQAFKVRPEADDQPPA